MEKPYLKTALFLVACAAVNFLPLRVSLNCQANPTITVDIVYIGPLLFLCFILQAGIGISPVCTDCSLWKIWAQKMILLDITSWLLFPGLAGRISNSFWSWGAKFSWVLVPTKMFLTIPGLFLNEMWRFLVAWSSYQSSREIACFEPPVDITGWKWTWWSLSFCCWSVFHTIQGKDLTRWGKSISSCHCRTRVVASKHSG